MHGVEYTRDQQRQVIHHFSAETAEYLFHFIDELLLLSPQSSASWLRRHPFREGFSQTP